MMPACRSRPLILIVVDSAETRQWWELVLLGLQYSVVTTSDGRTAMRLAHDLRPDVVLVDLMSPRIDFAELMDRLPLATSTIALAEQDELRMRALARDARAFLTKPVTTSDLIETIESVLADRLSHA